MGPSKLTLPFGWVQKQDYTEALTKGCPSRVRTLPSPSQRHWIMEMNAEGGHMPAMFISPFYYGRYPQANAIP